MKATGLRWIRFRAFSGVLFMVMIFTLPQARADRETSSILAYEREFTDQAEPPTARIIPLGWAFEPSRSTGSINF
jgi:hypothetical protein